METSIHALASVDPGAEIGEGARIGPFAVVGPGVRIGPRTVLMPHCHIVARTAIGADCVVSSSAVVGGDPQDMKYRGEDTNLVIGDRTRIGEFATVNRGTGVGGGVTAIGDDVLIMAYAHVAHDCVIGNGVVLTNSCQLAGHVRIEDQAWISGLCAVHHFVTIGAMSFVTPRSNVRFDVPPYMIGDGFDNTLRVRGVNVEGLARRRIPDASVRALKAAYRALYRGERPIAAAVAGLAGSELAKDPYVLNVLNHIEGSLAGYQNRALERYRTDKTRQIIRDE
ncbi:MAG: acyl-ACP--UDP-N-acetylglucosamine O-acyltransferase [Planctomycetota bacterium]|jgi:UDP-N-acetylglucosamine acyltransferase|nr:acyl-ACP--UDP-N-acetylglucosamine O-acyltransferase [Planctomycetota bacterium]